MDVEIVKKNGRKFRLSDYGVVKDFVVDSIDREVVRDSVDGRPGSLDYGVIEGDRSISVPFILKAKDLHDYAHLRDELYSLLGDREPFYIREMRRPKALQYDFVGFGQKPKWSSQTDNEYVNGRQYLVRLDNTISPSQKGIRGEVSLEFVTSGLPYAETTYTTLELHDSGYSATAEKYGLVDDIDDEKVKYRFNQDVKSNFIPKSDTRVLENMSSWRPRGTNVTMNASVQNESWYLLQVQNSGTYIATESDLLAFDLIAGEEYTLTYYAQPSALITEMDYNWLIRSGQPNLKLPSPKVTLNHGIRTGTTYYNKYDITFTAEFTGKCSVLIGGKLASGTQSFLYFSYPRLYKGAESKSWSEVIPDGGTTSFTVYNAGNVTIEPESMELRIRFRNAKNLGEIKLVNKTTGETFSTTADVGLTRHFEINGMVVKSGAKNIFRDTNRRFIRLAPGINEFDFSGATFDSLDFNFRFLYK